MSKNPIQKINAELANWLEQELNLLNKKAKERDALSGQLQSSRISMDEKQKIQILHTELASFLEQRLLHLDETIARFNNMGRQIMEVELESQKNESMFSILNEEFEGKKSNMQRTKERLSEQKKEHKPFHTDLNKISRKISTSRMMQSIV